MTNEPIIGDLIILLDLASGRPSNRVSKVMRVVSVDREEELFEVVDRYNQTRIVTAGVDARQWIEVEL